MSKLLILLGKLADAVLRDPIVPPGDGRTFVLVYVTLIASSDSADDARCPAKGATREVIIFKMVEERNRSLESKKARGSSIWKTRNREAGRPKRIFL